ncbi:MAG: methyltransferase [Saccharofermentanaceae bacterium]|jgi:16S rRNA (guanine1207-N2)-methyltransferase|nr:methyltransferase [Clostridia bacterium]NLX68553.1 methyltransferase [Clostridiaceae bacterium]HOO49239.1 methyltransferase [Saccharofermentans sp.]HPE28493.1 methyltransferase [Saccharofermentans sp.]HPG64012.1 methyltransferase [Saccharofermentans sp.]
MYEIVFNERLIIVETNVSLFSPKGADKGTLSMIKYACFSEEDKVLDLGCGTGIVSLAACSYGVKASCITMTDVDPIACEVALLNMKANGFEGANVVISDGLNEVSEKGFTIILSNPPYHTDFKIAKAFIEKGFNRLEVGGRMLMVTKRLDWYKNKFIAIFGGVKIHQEGDYFVFEAQKRTTQYAKAKK